MLVLFLYWFGYSAFGLASDNPSSIAVGVSGNRTIILDDLSRVAVANSRVLKVRAIPPRELLITGLRPGRTMVRVWTRRGYERAYDVTVLPASTYDSYLPGGREAVVKVALEFMEVDAIFHQNVGLRWPEAIQFSFGGVLQGGQGTTGLNYTASFSTARGMLNFLLKEGMAKLVARPEIRVRLGEEATFHSGGEIPVSTSSEHYGRYHKHIEWKSFGLTAKVRPASADGYHLHSDIRLEISEINRGTVWDGVPEVARRQLETKVDSLEGETVILSGLVRHSTASDQEGLPILSQIPLLGELFFGGKARNREGTELFMAITLSMLNRARERERLSELHERLDGTP